MHTDDSDGIYNRIQLTDRHLVPLGDTGRANKGQELLSSLLLGSETSQHGAGDGGRTWLLNTSHGHAHVAGVSSAQHHTFMSWLEERRKGEAKKRDGGWDQGLQLEVRTRTHLASITTATPLGLIASSTANATCLVNLSCTCNLLENVSAILASFDRPNTSLFGIYPIEIYLISTPRVEITHLPGEWDHMVFTQTENIYIPHNHHLIMIFGKDSIVNHIHQSLFIPLGHPHEGFGISFRCTE